MKNNLPKFTIREMLSSGVHYGHKKNRWNPQMSQFIYGAKEGVHIIDLTKTYALLQEALQVVANVASNNGKILFIGTKKQLAGTIEKHAQDCNQYYVNHRWLGGMLTNWLTVSNSIKTLKNIESELDNEDSKLTKKELLYLSKKHEKLNKSLGGIRELRNMPSLAIVFDTIKESNAILEVKKLGIPVVAVVDSNSSLNNINYPIPGNDDSAKSVGFFCDLFAKTIKSFGNYQVAKVDKAKEVEKLKEKNKVAVKDTKKKPVAEKVAKSAVEKVAKSAVEEATKVDSKSQEEK
jgi:small subunit ribosomal protein S2